MAGGRDAPMPGQKQDGRRPLRVCHVAYTFYENDGRVSRYAEALAERGDDVDVIALQRPGLPSERETNGVKVHRIQKRSVNEANAAAYLTKVLWFLFKSMLTVARLHASRPYDIVHVHNIPDFLILAALRPKISGARIILDIHDVVPELYASKFGVGEHALVYRALLLIERLSCRFADRVIVANHLWHSKLVGRSVKSEKCTTIMNYPDCRLFKPLPPANGASRGKFTFLYPGTLNHHQGVDVAIEAFARASPRMPEAEFHIYGDGPDRDGLERKVRSLGVGEYVKIRDRIPLVEMAGLMASADAGIVPKRASGFGDEAFSTKILEFMSCGVPVIVSETTIDRHYFDDSLVRFFESEDETALSEAMIELYEGRLNGERRQVADGLVFAAHHSWQARAVEYLQLIDSLGSRKGDDVA